MFYLDTPCLHWRPQHAAHQRCPHSTHTSIDGRPQRSACRCTADARRHRAAGSGALRGIGCSTRGSGTLRGLLLLCVRGLLSPCLKNKRKRRNGISPLRRINVTWNKSSLCTSAQRVKLPDKNIYLSWKVDFSFTATPRLQTKDSPTTLREWKRHEQQTQKYLSIDALRPPHSYAF